MLPDLSTKLALPTFLELQLACHVQSSANEVSFPDLTAVITDFLRCELLVQEAVPNCNKTAF